MLLDPGDNGLTWIFGNEEMKTCEILSTFFSTWNERSALLVSTLCFNRWAPAYNGWLLGARVVGRHLIYGRKIGPPKSISMITDYIRLYYKNKSCLTETDDSVKDSMHRRSDSAWTNSATITYSIVNESARESFELCTRRDSFLDPFVIHAWG